MNSIGALNFELVLTLFQEIKVSRICSLFLYKWTTKIAWGLSSFSITWWIDRLNNWRIAVLLESLISWRWCLLFSLIHEGIDTFFLGCVSHGEKSKAILLSRGRRVVSLFVGIEGVYSLGLFSDGGLFFHFFLVHILNNADKFSLILLWFFDILLHISYSHDKVIYFVALIFVCLSWRCFPLLWFWLAHFGLYYLT